MRRSYELRFMGGRTRMSKNEIKIKIKSMSMSMRKEHHEAMIESRKAGTPAQN